MTGSVSTRWYFSDWMSDQNVRSCSLAARGLWMDMLCICAAAQGKLYGYLTIAGKAVTPGHLARLVQATESEVASLIDELERNAVFSRTRNGLIYCRRMIRAAKYRDNGRLGGNPNLLNGKEKKKRVRVKPNLPPGSGTGSYSLDSESKAGVESENLFSSEDSLGLKVVSAERSRGRDGFSFDEFWAQYPHKVGKGRARSSFESVCKKGLVAFPELMLGLARYAAKDDERPWCNPATWLNQERWLDEPARNGGSNERTPKTLAERAFQLADQARALEAARRAGRSG